ncbi:5-dehydro-2-deoxygluconokinase [Paraburkholderia sp. BL10I2N1]|uniref:bifunctional 5-dehydro-2-deoxygluconokinase/5-dehydro-2- deoxyphosphogluconate aldolase n=1 Tax=Paraburkholderia sp. BL10I2N1 TaxID=1938796 RepID=UPI00105E1558|nr:5-dehydro-2-deoxygluconokinase [Paraburkholderia sp. BL10I2N1]TDN63172.1 5-dehydro-2-deoxygluconokinase [Paraburkholderia sp. BL10I2N1]
MKNSTSFANHRRLDLICLGRLLVDLYANDIGARLEDVTHFSKYLGGSSGNVAFGTARLGMKSAMLSRVGDEQMGRFLLETLEREGCDVSQVKLDPDHLTALVLLGIKDRQSFPLLFYRDHCADMALSVDDIDESFIASSKALAITGTHLSRPGVHAAARRALEYARRNNVRTVLDIDYRPVLWGLASKGDGETRFVAHSSVTQHLRAILPEFDLIVGTEEEFRIAGGSDDLMDCLRSVREISDATLVVKLGPLGCVVIDGAILAKIEDAGLHCGVQVEVLNVLGAGDAFLSGFLSGWLRGEDYAACCRYANACGALVVSRHGCAPAMPTPAELAYFLDVQPSRPAEDARLNHLHRVTVARKQRDELLVFAFDHRSQLADVAQQTGQSESRIGQLKQLLVETVAEVEQEHGLTGKVGILADDRYGQDALNAATGRGWWIGRPVELPMSNPLEFEWGRSIGSHLASWPKEHVVKCLVQYHPDDTIDNRLEQEAQLLALYQAVQVSGHELLLEVIPPGNLPQMSDTVLRALTRLYDLGICPDWWKLEQPAAQAWPAIDALISGRDPYCRGVVLLGLNVPVDRLREGFRAARASTTCRGFAVGRTIFYEASRKWFAGELDDAGLKRETAAIFVTLVDAWREETGRRA